MDPFVRRLIERVLDPEAPLSRNRHFHAFDNPDGRYALKTSRRLKALQRDILACRQEGRKARFVRHDEEGKEGSYSIELVLERIKGRRVAMLEAAEFELLSGLPGVRDALTG